MLLIWGFKVRLKTISTLMFFCPSCGGDRTGAVRSARRWFTLFWIPIIPLKQLGEIVECETCHHQFDPAVTQQPTTAALGDLQTNAIHALTLMVVQAGDATDPALRQAAQHQLHATVIGYDPSTFDRDVSLVDQNQAEQYVAPLHDSLQVSAKERIVTDLVRVAIAGTSFTPAQRHLIDRVGQALGLTAAHLTGIVTSVAATRDPAPGEGGVPGV